MTPIYYADVSVAQVEAICRKYGVAEMALFGSAARGDMKPDSDVDIMVEFLPGEHPGIGFFRLEDDLAALFGRRVDVSVRSLLKPRVRPNAERDAIFLYGAACPGQGPIWPL